MFQSILRGALAAAGFAIVLPAMTMPASAAEYAVTTRMNVQYVEHDGVKLTGNLYSPKGRDKAPVIVAVHGGGWQVGAPSTYQHWGPMLAKNGYAVFAIRYRLIETRCEDLSRCGLRREGSDPICPRQCRGAWRRSGPHRA